MDGSYTEVDKMKYCIDCKHSTISCHKDKMFCNGVVETIESPVWGKLKSRYNNFCVELRKETGQCGLDAKYYKRKWWKFWRPK